MRPIARHLEGEGPHNPFPGLAAAERKMGRKLPYQLGSNEGLDIPLKALSETFGHEVATLARRYADAESHDLRVQLSERLAIGRDDLVVDAGADSLMALSLRTLCEPGDVAITSKGTYPTFSYFAQSTGCRLIEAFYKEQAGVLAPDLDALVEMAHHHHARLVYLANPDNPSGYLYSMAEIIALRDQLPGDCWLLLDEAYYEFHDENHSQPLEGIIRLRTFSKAYGLAGLRIGYAIADPEVIKAMLKARIHYAVASVSLAAAEFQLNQQEEVKAHIAQVAHQREQLIRRLEAANVQVYPSATNFVAVNLDSAEEAARVQGELLAQDVIVHRPPHPALGHILRITSVADALTEGRLAPLLKAGSPS